MSKKLIIIIILSVMILIGAGCASTEEKFEECKAQCLKIPSQKGGIGSPIDYSDRNACTQMCIEKYK